MDAHRLCYTLPDAVAAGRALAEVRQAQPNFPEFLKSGASQDASQVWLVLPAFHPETPVRPDVLAHGPASELPVPVVPDPGKSGVPASDLPEGERAHRDAAAAAVRQRPDFAAAAATIWQQDLDAAAPPDVGPVDLPTDGWATALPALQNENHAKAHRVVARDVAAQVRSASGRSEHPDADRTDAAAPAASAPPVQP